MSNRATRWLRHARTFVARHEPPEALLLHVKSGVGAMAGMGIVGWLASSTGLPLLLAPLGATAVLLFGQPNSPLAQPVNVMIGYLIATLVSELAVFLFPGIWVAAAVAVGLTVMLMLILRVTHPPAGAMPLLAFSTGMHGVNLFLITLIGSIVLIFIAFAVHRVPPRRIYPRQMG